jgi:hypothetical protein
VQHPDNRSCGATIVIDARKCRPETTGLPVFLDSERLRAPGLTVKMPVVTAGFPGSTRNETAPPSEAATRALKSTSYGVTSKTVPQLGFVGP